MIITIPRHFQGTIVVHADDAPILSGLLCRARPCGSEEHGGIRVVVVDPGAPVSVVGHVVEKHSAIDEVGE